MKKCSHFRDPTPSANQGWGLLNHKIGMAADEPFDEDDKSAKPFKWPPYTTEHPLHVKLDIPPKVIDIPILRINVLFEKN